MSSRIPNTADLHLRGVTDDKIRYWLTALRERAGKEAIYKKAAAAFQESERACEAKYNEMMEALKGDDYWKGQPILLPQERCLLTYDPATEHLSRQNYKVSGHTMHLEKQMDEAAATRAKDAAELPKEE